MSFQGHFARTFSVRAILQEAPAASGVYGLSNAAEWIYVGETDDIRASLLEHLKEAGVRMPDVPTGFSFELCSPGRRLARQRRLILELGPTRNRSTNQPSASRGAASVEERS